jgi:hypothetical protein
MCKHTFHEWLNITGSNLTLITFVGVYELFLDSLISPEKKGIVPYDIYRPCIFLFYLNLMSLLP